MHPMLNIAVRAARSAGAIIAQYADRVDSITFDNKSENDFVSDVDRAAEEEIIRTIKKAYPDHSILAEESGLVMSIISMVDPAQPIIRAFYEGVKEKEIPIRS